jgi:hypothetical protein
MDTGTIMARVAAGEYTDAAATGAGVAPSPIVRSGVFAGAWALVRRDVALVAANCRAFNPPESIYAKEADRLKACPMRALQQVHRFARLTIARPPVHARPVSR